MRLSGLVLVPCLAAVVFACGASADDFDTTEDGLSKYGGLREGSDEACAVLRLANEADERALDALLDSRAAKNIVAHRAAPDGRVGTEDDQWFAKLADLDRVSYVATRA